MVSELTSKVQQDDRSSGGMIASFSQCDGRTMNGSEGFKLATGPPPMVSFSVECLVEGEQDLSRWLARPP